MLLGVFLALWYLVFLILYDCVLAQNAYTHSDSIVFAFTTLSVVALIALAGSLLFLTGGLLFVQVRILLTGRTGADDHASRGKDVQLKASMQLSLKHQSAEYHIPYYRGLSACPLFCFAHCTTMKERE